MTSTRKRSLTPALFARLVALPPEVRLTEHGLRLYADDHGRGRVNLRLILGTIYPETSSITEETLTEHLLQLDEVGAIDIYPDENNATVFQFVEWPTVDRPGRSDVPEPPVWKDSRNSRDSFVAGESEREREREGEQESGGESDEGEAQSRMLREGLPPNPFCSAHASSGGIEYPCIACQNARLNNQHFLARRRFEMQQSLRGDDDER